MITIGFTITDFLAAALDTPADDSLSQRLTTSQSDKTLDLLFQLQTGDLGIMDFSACRGIPGDQPWED